MAQGAPRGGYGSLDNVDGRNDRNAVEGDSLPVGGGRGTLERLWREAGLLAAVVEVLADEVMESGELPMGARVVERLPEEVFARIMGSMVEGVLPGGSTLPAIHGEALRRARQG